jgi:3-oxoacyl-[acyl-carrier-protein] synthase-3
MNFEYENASIRGVQLVLPRNEKIFDDEVGLYSFSPSQSKKLKAVMGYEKRRVVTEGVVSSDLIVAGFESIFNDKMIDKSSIDALIIVTQTPDYLIPGTSFIVHGMLGLDQNVMCLDVNQGCAGFIVGLFTALSLLGQSGINRVALVNVDVLSRLVSTSDRSSRPIIGDAASITILDSNRSAEKIYGNLKVDGTGWDALMVPAGGMKIRPSSETAKISIDCNGNSRALENLVMKGDAVFNFVMREVPPMILDLLDFAGIGISEIDSFVFHQPNPFMLKKIADKLEIPHERIPMTLVSEFGNSSGVSIPAVLCTALGAKYFEQNRTICFAGFGVGLTWGSVIMHMGDLSFLRVLEV